MRRRFVIAAAGGAAAWPFAARAQQTAGPIKRIGVLQPYAANEAATLAHLASFRAALQELGWLEGKNAQIEYRWAGGDVGRLSSLASELVALRTDVILVRSTPVAVAAARSTRTTPIVFVVVSDPVGDGLVASLARPGGNVTGFTNAEASLAGKWLQLLKELAPRVTRILYLFDPQASAGAGRYYLDLLTAAAASVDVKVVSAIVRDEAETVRAIAGHAAEPNGGLIAAPSVTTTLHRHRIIAETAAHRMPAIFGFPSFAAEGGLMAYGADVGTLYRRAAGYVDRLLRGAKPADLPVQAPEKFQLAINLKTASALGLTVPSSLLDRADEVIE